MKNVELKTVLTYLCHDVKKNALRKDVKDLLLLVFWLSLEVIKKLNVI